MEISKDHRVELGNQLRELRNEKGLSVRELCDRTGINFSNINKIENGRYNVSIDILSTILESLGAKLTIEKK